MRITIQFEVSKGSHSYDLSEDDLNQICSEGRVYIEQQDPEKSLSIGGTPDELELLAEALMNCANSNR